MPFTLTPAYGQAGTYTAQSDRLLMASQASTLGNVKIGAPSSGVLTGDCAVVSSGTGNASLNLLSGGIYLRWSSTSGQGMYYAFNDATISNAFTLGANSSGNPRIDLLSIKINDTGSAAPTVTLQVTAGTPAASPSVPALPADSTPLAYVTVPNGFTASSTVSSANIVDQRYKANTPDLAAWGAGAFSTQNVGQLAYFVNQSNPHNRFANQLMIHNGTSFIGASGLQPLTAAGVFSGSAVNLDSIFTSAFANYRLVFFEVGFSAATQLNLRLRTGGVTNTTANYSWSAYGWQSSSGTVGLGATATNLVAMYPSPGSGTASGVSFVVDVLSPQRTAITRLLGQSQYGFNGVAGFGNTNFGGTFNATTSFDGLSIFPTSGSFTDGQVIVFGYNY